MCSPPGMISANRESQDALYFHCEEFLIAKFTLFYLHLAAFVHLIAVSIDLIKTVWTIEKVLKMNTYLTIFPE